MFSTEILSQQLAVKVNAFLVKLSVSPLILFFLTKILFYRFVMHQHMAIISCLFSSELMGAFNQASRNFNLVTWDRIWIDTWL